MRNVPVKKVKKLAIFLPKVPGNTVARIPNLLPPLFLHDATHYPPQKNARIGIPTLVYMQGEGNFLSLPSPSLGNTDPRRGGGTPKVCYCTYSTILAASSFRLHRRGGGCCPILQSSRVSPLGQFRIASKKASDASSRGGFS